MRRHSTPLASLLLLGVLCSACARDRYQVSSLSDAGPGDAGAVDPEFPVTGIGSNQLVVTGVEPAAGPFSGGTSAVVRGGGFSKDAIVRIGGSMVQPGSVTFDDKGRLAIIVPAGKVGAADVTVIEGDREATLRDGYHYNALALEPSSGSTAGGTLIEVLVSGATLVDGVALEIDGAPCTELVQLTPQRLRCKTPGHVLGTVDVTLRFPEPDAHSIIARQAFAYVETGDEGRGGLSGGAIDHVLNITVVDSGGGFVIPGAFVLVGDDPNGPHQGLTDARGKITFSGDDLQGPVSVHVYKECFERSSIVGFDAQNATLFLSPILDFSCADFREPDPRHGHGQLGSIISGELIFAGSDEFGVNPWEIVPRPKPGEARVAYVFTTQAGVDDPNPPAGGGGGAIARLEESSAVAGERGYLYSIFARPAGLAVYALAGLERASDGRFTPYAMGVTRNVVTSPGDENQHVDIEVSITLDRELAVSVSGMPAAVSGSPNQYRVESYVDLGGEGVISRRVQGVSLDVITRYTPTSVFRFIGQPAFVDALSDASYGIVAGFYTDAHELPYTEQTRVGVTQASSALALSDFLGIPQAVAPREGGALPADRTLRFAIDGAEPDVIEVELIGGDGNPAWWIVLPGSAREVTLPDLSSIPDVVDIAKGTITWTVRSSKVDDFVFDELEYADLSPRKQTHSAGNVFVMRR